MRLVAMPVATSLICFCRYSVRTLCAPEVIEKFFHSIYFLIRANLNSDQYSATTQLRVVNLRTVLRNTRADQRTD
jgi:hypothetical protein